jgi:hypothetical protein
MSSRFNFALLNLCVVLVASILVPIARAEQWDKETVVTFNHPIEVPGNVLPAGTYVFKLASSESDRQIVQIFTKDHRKIVATIHTIADYRLQPTDKSVISLDERPSGKPEALRSWFYPGENYGVHFVYPKRAVDNTENAANEVAANAEPPAIIPPLTGSVPPDVSELTSPPAAPVLGDQDPEPAVLAENSGPAPTQVQLSRLPKTASNFLVLPLVGLFLIGGGSVILVGIRRSSRQTSNS